MDLPDTIDLVRRSIVQIADAEDLAADFAEFNLLRPSRGALGTGFVVNEGGTIITARHVIEGIPPERLRVGFAREETEGVGASFRYWGLEVVEEDPRHDLAVLRLTGSRPLSEVTVAFTAGPVVVLSGDSDEHARHPVTLRRERPRSGTAIAVSGYPLSSAVLVTNAGHLATSRGTEERELRGPGIPAGFRDPDVADAYLADVQSNPGNSGGPIYQIDDGTVIGVCVAGRLTEVVDQDGNSVVLPDKRALYFDARLAVVVPTRYVVDVLERQGLNWTSIDSGNPA